MSNLILLSKRAIIEISGEDRQKFLQGLITNDIYKVSPNLLIYSAMLNAQGRFLYDFFIFEKDQILYLDCNLLKRDEIIQKLSLYKLRSKVTIKKNDNLKIFYNQSKQGFPDPRHNDLGYRFYSEISVASSDLEGEKQYDLKRISLKIAEGESDLTSDKSFILEFGFDNLNAIDYQKGCYVGQELTARTHYRGEIRKKLIHVKIESLQTVDKNSEIACEGKSAGIILSSVFHENELHALALVKDSSDIDETKLDLSGHKIFIVD